MRIEATGPASAATKNGASRPPSAAGKASNGSGSSLRLSSSVGRRSIGESDAFSTWNRTW